MVYGNRLPLLSHAGASRGEIVILAEEVQDSKYTISMQLSASHLDKKDFFGKVHVDTCTTNRGAVEYPGIHRNFMDAICPLLSTKAQYMYIHVAIF